ncbi:protein TolQ [Anaplasmataceae bacterium AB001_6]|nr:protein TolQ [Anaplasmataceae bacterium AB001_6]
MSIFAIFAQSDLVIKSLLIFLFLTSVMSWALAVYKFFLIRKHMHRKVYFENLFFSGKIDEQFLLDLKKDGSSNAVINIFFTGFQILRRSKIKNNNKDEINELKAIIRNRMEYKMQKELQNVEKNLDWLATIGSVAPFIGLFGTVWGIMHSFSSLAGVKTVTLSVIAPSISEALLATAVGLFVAIPAVIFYNRIIIMLDDLRNQLADFISNFCNLLINKEFCGNL